MRATLLPRDTTPAPSGAERFALERPIVVATALPLRVAWRASKRCRGRTDLRGMVANFKPAEASASGVAAYAPVPL